MMVDWVTAKIPIAHDKGIIGGRFLSHDQDGEIDFEFNKFFQFEGSYSSKIGIKTICLGDNGIIEISGNPNKFLQGHNLFGSTDIVEIMKNTLELIFPVLDITPSEYHWRDIITGNYHLSRIDINTMYELQSLNHVLEWIRAASHASRSRHKSSGVLKGDTLYWGKNSRRWSMKAYAKGQEILVKNHGIHGNVPFRMELIEWAQNKLRFELVLRGQELKKINADTAASFCNQSAENIFKKYRERILLPDNFSLTPEFVSNLPRRYRTTYALWKSGEDLRRTLSKNTYYNHRGIFKKLGIDISIKATLENEEKISFTKILESIPAEIPIFL